MYLKNPSEKDIGYWWVKVPSLKLPMVVEVAFRTWDHTRDGDMWIIIDGEQIVEFDNKEWFEYNFIEKINPPKEENN